jgi:CRP/FNR family cyclic AMP-dependent transcriptional regulator
MRGARSGAEELQANAERQLVRVLEVDPDLALALQESERQEATNSLVAGCYDVRAGGWELREPARERGALGLLVVRGALGLRTSIGGRATLELVGPGDVLQPWVQLETEATVPPSAGWHVFEPSQLILLDRRFARAAARWPEIMSALMYRLVVRSRRLCYQLAVNASPRVGERILFALWALADRWGHVTDDGVVLKLNLAHQQLAELVGAQRPSVSAALARLREERRLSYSRGAFVLRGDPPAPVEELKRQVALQV